MSSAKVEDNVFSGRQGDECTEQVEMVFGVAGTYWACPDEAFPGLFSDPNSNTEIATEARQALPEPPSCPSCPKPSCPACPPDSTLPSPQDYAAVMAPFVQVMGPVCDLVSMEVVNLDSGNAAASP